MSTGLAKIRLVAGWVVVLGVSLIACTPSEEPSLPPCQGKDRRALDRILSDWEVDVEPRIDDSGSGCRVSAGDSVLVEMRWSVIEVSEFERLKAASEGNPSASVDRCGNLTRTQASADSGDVFTTLVSRDRYAWVDVIDERVSEAQQQALVEHLRAAIGINPACG